MRAPLRRGRGDPVTPAIVVHGGAGRIADEHHQQARRAVADAAEAGRSVLVAGGDCEAAVLAAVREL
ncbi:MAG: isoaspartyl peptidase/L-asparaginase, partial [Deltaproteobacteria bacterium]|nr:isoaspartyl peptidase/L-asparaginase [Deltaproteobacteria bacterium]